MIIQNLHNNARMDTVDTKYKAWNLKRIIILLYNIFNLDFQSE